MNLDTETVPSAITRLSNQLRAAQAASPSLWRRWMDDPALYRRACEEARRLAPQRFPHLFDPDLLRRLTPIVVLDTGEDAETVKPVEPLKRARVARQATLPPTLAPRLICREAAASYVSVSPNTFDAMVADGRMPNPLQLTERRLAWDMRQLDAAIDRLPIAGDADTDTTDHSWDDIDAQAKTKPTVR